MDTRQAYAIAALFDLPGQIEVFDFPEKGNINRETYLIAAGHPGNRAEYILQRLNPTVFKKPADVMQAMISCIEAQKDAISGGALRDCSEWEPIRLIRTNEGNAYLETVCDDGPSCWRVMARIGRARSYKNLRQISSAGMRLKTAEEVGRGLALFGTLTARMNPLQVQCPLPGYRDTPLYYAQLLSVLAGNRSLDEATPYLPADPELRQSTQEYFLVQAGEEEFRRRLQDALVSRCIGAALENESFALKLVNGLQTGELRTAIIHGDTKLENFLFSTRTGKAIALVDLDTIMPHTWLSDWGDMTRSLINLAGEKETDLEQVRADIRIFERAARGFLRAARHVTEREMALMSDAVQIMSLELGVRFLTDYLRGDSYFRLGPADPPHLNKIRACVQFRLFETMHSNADVFEKIIADCCREKSTAPGF